jgi:hypothetical protein
MPWTTEEATAQLTLNPKDPYLQYVVLQLARRNNTVGEVAGQVEALIGGGGRRDPGRGAQVDLFSIFTGALAVQESLQLDTMRGGPSRNALRPNTPDGPPQAKPDARTKVAVSSLKGPTIQSHPWEKLLGGKKPAISSLSLNIPEDFYLAEFRSLAKLLEASEVSNLWGTHLFNQTTREARTQAVGARLRQQLAVESTPWGRVVGDQIIDEVALTGSDLFLAEGSDVTMLFQFRQPEVFKAGMDDLLAKAEKARSDARRTTGTVLGVSFTHVATPDRVLCVYSAYPLPNLHVRSNSQTALQRVLEAVRGKKSDGRPVRRLGDSLEFAYIRTLMPRDAAKEDGFIYLSDPFIRRLVGPALKLTERRRMLCYNHLRMINHAALMYRTEFGKPAPSLEALVQTACAPPFGEKELACPDGGKYSLAADGTTAVCSHHGHSGSLTPCCDIPVTEVTGAEAEEYQAFLDDYNQYWRTYFDPIALRIQITPRAYRLETIVLPLIDNTIYKTLAHTLGGKSEPLDSLPVPKRNILSLAVRFNKEALLKEVGAEELAQGLKFAGIPGLSEAEIEKLRIQEVWSKGIGNQVGLHIYDAAPMFDFDVLGALGMLFGTFNARNVGDAEMAWALPIGFLVSALNSPVYASFTVQHAGVVDRFLEALDQMLARVARQNRGMGRFGIQIEPDFYRMNTQPEQTVRCASVKIWTFKWRFFWARIGKGLYVASKPFILEDLVAAEAERSRQSPGAEVGPVGHAMVRLRAQNWDHVLPDYRLGWAENNREACLANLGPLASVARANPDSEPNDHPLSATVSQLAEKLYDVRFFCPDGGRYSVSADGKSCSCAIHGSQLRPRQPPAPAADSATGKLLRTLGGLTAELQFLEDGLHAVVTIERK